MGEACLVHRPDGPPHRLQQRVVDLVRWELVERRPVHPAQRQDLRAVLERGQRRHLGAGHPAAAGHEEHERLVADLDRHRAAGRGRHRLAELHRAVAAVEGVGITAVALVDLQEQVGSLGSGGAVQEGAAAVGPQQAQLGDRDPGPGQRVADHGRRGPPVRGAEHHQDRGPRGQAGGEGQEQVRHARGAGDGQHERQDAEGDVAGPPPGPGKPRLPDDGRRGRRREVPDRREARRRHPGVAVQRPFGPAGELDGGVHQREHRDAGRGRQQPDAQSPPPALHDEDDDDRQRHEDGAHLGEGEGQLAHGLGQS